MVKLWRCRNPRCASGPHGHDFEAEVPVCPSCGTDGSLPAFRTCVIERIVIHYEPPSAFHGIGTGVTLCDGLAAHRLHLRRPMEQATADPAVVNCPVCKAHADFPPEATWHEITTANFGQGTGAQTVGELGKKPCGGCK